VTTVVPVGADVFNLAAADLDGDGKVDLLATTGANDLLVFRSRNARSFSAPERHPVIGQRGRLVVGDFDGDGSPDVAVGTFAGISLFLNRGDGTFRAPVVVAATTVIAMTAVDVDGDGRSDLAYLADDGVHVLFGAPARQFVPGPVLAADGLSLLTLVAMPDLLGPAVILVGPREISVLRFAGAWQTDGTLSLPFRPATVATGDINLDGWTDLIVLGANGSYQVFLGGCQP
jgi:hypothetical protein